MLVELYAKLQTNPKNQAVYRRISKYYHSQGMLNEGLAFEELIQKKFNASPPDHPEQRKDNRQDP
jgi:hypothetical protein